GRDGSDLTRLLPRGVDHLGQSLAPRPVQVDGGETERECRGSLTRATRRPGPALPPGHTRLPATSARTNGIVCGPSGSTQTRAPGPAPATSAPTVAARS